MLRRLTFWTRPLGVALGIFILLNLALALQKPDLAVTRIWLRMPLAEPELSLFAALLGGALFLPDSLGSAPWMRWLAGGIFFGFLILAGSSAVAYYDSLYRGVFSSDLPVPFSAFIFLILLAEFVRVSSWAPVEPITPPPARLFFRAILVAASFLLLTLVHVVTFGHTDYRRPADAGVIFGAKVYPDGTPCAALRDRLETGIDLYRRGYVRCLIMTGAVDPNGQSEPEVMRQYALGRGVPVSSIIVDESGVNTRASALSVRAIASHFGFEKLLAVTQYFHCARVKLIFDREGAPCYTVPTCSLERSLPGATRKLSREGFFLLREAVAFPFYLIYYRS